MDYTDIIQMQNFWPEWEIIEEIGRGAYGTVYKAVRHDPGKDTYSAIKVINIPNDKSELNILASEGLDEEGIRAYLYKIVTEFVNEIGLMESLKGNQNIVAIQDYNVIEKTDELGWLIYIRMELLLPFVEYILYNRMEEYQVVQLGIDMCSALDMCEKNNIIHRDIKPDNVFMSDLGCYKLGDFGIARRMEGLTHGLSKKGTFNYMAPEVIMGKTYDSRVDIYSLGIMLYKLLNNNHLPFIETEEQLIDAAYKREAVERRMHGEKLAPPCTASPEMARIILKACAFKPEDRYNTAAEMKNDLLAVQRSLGGAAPSSGSRVSGAEAEKISKLVGSYDVDKTVFINIPEDPGTVGTASIKDYTSSSVGSQKLSVNEELISGGSGSGKRYIPIIAAAAVAVIALGVILTALVLRSAEEPVETANLAETASVPETAANEPETAAADVTEQYIMLALDEAAAAAGNGDYDLAMGILEAAMQNYGYDSRLLESYDEYRKMAPAEETTAAPETTAPETEAPIDENVAKIAILTYPTQMEYTKGDDFNPSGMSLKVKYKDGSTKTVSGQKASYSYDFSIVGERTVTVLFGGQYVGFDVIVKEKTVTNIELSSYDIDMKVGETRNLTAMISVKPSDAPDRSVKLTSANPSVVKVEDDGFTVIAKGAGKTTVTIKSSNGITAKLNVTVTQPVVETVTIVQSDISLKVGESMKLNITVTPGDADKTIDLTSSDDSVVKVDDKNKKEFVIYAVGAGEAVLTAKAANGVSATCRVTVSASKP